jgi:hypothetical protein
MPNRFNGFGVDLARAMVETVDFTSMEGSRPLKWGINERLDRALLATRPSRVPCPLIAERCLKVAVGLQPTDGTLRIIHFQPLAESPSDD